MTAELTFEKFRQILSPGGTDRGGRDGVWGGGGQGDGIGRRRRGVRGGGGGVWGGEEGGGGGGGEGWEAEGVLSQEEEERIR